MDFNADKSSDVNITEGVEKSMRVLVCTEFDEGASITDKQRGLDTLVPIERDKLR